MDFLLRLKIRNNLIEKTNEGVKHASYERVLQKRQKDAFVQRVGKNNVFLCPCNPTIIRI
jgi:hypothetical protein